MVEIATDVKVYTIYVNIYWAFMNRIQIGNKNV